MDSFIDSDDDDVIFCEIDLEQTPQVRHLEVNLEKHFKTSFQNKHFFYKFRFSREISAINSSDKNNGK
jgi:hypothetical protein